MNFPPNKNDYKVYKNDYKKIFNNIIEKSIESFSSQVVIYKNNKKILDLKNIKDDNMIETLSVTKSFCSIAVMFLIQDKKIKSIDDFVSTYIKSWKYGLKKDITLKHILTHTSGLDKFFSFDHFMWPEGKLELLGKEKGPNVFEISKVIDKNRENNEEWYYNDTATQVIPTLVKIITSKQIDEYLNKKLFKPLNIKFKWNKDSYGNCYGPNGLRISADNLCKVGVLLVNKGKYNKKIILKNSLINILLEKHISLKKIKNDKRFANAGTGYGLFWWNYYDLNTASGYLGQNLIIDRKNKIVAARLIQAKWENEKFVEETFKDTLYFNSFKKLIKNLK